MGQGGFRSQSRVRARPRSSLRGGRMVSVAAVQMGVAEGNVQENLRACAARLEEAASIGVKLVVFPECVLTGYVFDDRQAAYRAAVSLTGPSVESLREMCRVTGVYCVVGLLERERRRLFNTALLVGPHGVVARYRKAHLPVNGADRFVDRSEGPGPVTGATPLGAVGLAICYDLRFPEWTRALVLSGAGLVACPANFTPTARVLAEKFVPVRACENRCFLVVANRCDSEAGVEFIGMSQIAGPDGRVLARAGRGEEKMVVADIDPGEAKRKCLITEPGASEVHLLSDRRPELYGALVSRPEVCDCEGRPRA